MGHKKRGGRRNRQQRREHRKQSREQSQKKTYYYDNNHEDNVLPLWPSSKNVKQKQIGFVRSSSSSFHTTKPRDVVAIAEEMFGGQYYCIGDDLEVSAVS